ncbi:MAG: sugar phosphate isomerase/epimerase [Clostridia bacterium]|jgi:sugar phosphate isomerase/epimerase|nr:sugar phosphate isomerase/epimerase [Clostridia bacterium]
MNVATSLNVGFDYNYKVSVRKQLEQVYNAGFRYIDINFSDWSMNEKSPFVGKDWESWVNEIRRFGEDYGITYHQAHAPIYNIFSTDENTKFLDKMTLRSIISAGMLNIPWIVIHAGHTVGNYDAVHIADMKQKNIDWFSYAVKEAENSKTGIALENMADAFGRNGHYCSNTDDLIELIDSFDPKYVGACWDTGHAHINGYNQYEHIIKFGKRLKVLHIQDGDGKRDLHTAPFYGTIDWKSVRKALHDIDYDGSPYYGKFTFEAHNLVRLLPIPCQDEALKLLYKIGNYIANEMIY